MKRVLTIAATSMALSPWTIAMADDNNSAYVEQIGAGNSMIVTQTHDASITSVTSNNNRIGSTGSPASQQGNNNEMRLEQGRHSGGDDSMGESGAGIDQIGDDNFMRLEQLDGPNVIVHAQQNGNSNHMHVAQAGFPVGAILNLGAQHGDDNFAQVLQIGSPGSTVGFGQGSETNAAFRNSAQLIQTFGSGANAINAVQFGADNTLFIEQAGGLHTAGASQDGELNDTTIVQSGAENAAAVSLVGLSNFVNLNQSNDLNSANIDFTGDGNRLMVEQSSGMNNSVVVNMTGNLNGNSVFTSGGAAASIAQLTAIPNGSAQILQSGGDNSATVTGTNADGNTFGLEQQGSSNTIVGHLTNGAGTGGNEAAVFQGGSFNSANFTQSGTGNSLGIAQ